ncbi:MAG: metallophosphatase family protein [Polyangiaceae bacterium]|nr:metallophosphatase family protein [Polyangiaceae bacterium]
MRWALLADVHGNLEALRAVLRDLDGWPEHRLICAGDIVGYGPDPEACLELLAERAATCVVGNHEQMVLGRLDFGRCVYAGIRAAIWTREHLSPWALGHLASLPGVTRPASDVVVCHAIPEDVQHYVTTAASAERALAQASLRHPGFDLLVCGHTHFAAFHRRDASFVWAQPGASRRVVAGLTQLVNPGSVGQPRDGKQAARYARFDSSTGALSWHAVDYDVAPTLAKLRQRRLVARVCYSFPQTWARRTFEGIRSKRAYQRFKTLPPLHYSQ